MYGEKEIYNKLRIFLSIFGISYSYYINECNDILSYNEEEEGFNISEYIKSFIKMKNTNEGYLYWRTLKFIWFSLTYRRKTLSELKKSPLSISDCSYLTIIGDENAVKNIDKTIELFNKLLNLGFKFKCLISDNENYSKVIMHFKDNENFSYYGR